MNDLAWTHDLDLGSHTLRAATTADAEALATLMAEPDVDQWWHQRWDPHRWAAHLAGLAGDPHTLPLVLTADSTVAGYVEVYRVAADVLGRHIEHRDADLGMHLALGKHARGRGLGTRVIGAIRETATSILDGCDRLVTEPDLRNTRSHRAFAAAGLRPVGLVQLPDKTAQLMAAQVTPAAHPHDIVAVGAGPFNLGLAALVDTVPDLDTVVFDRAAELTWHRGLMLDGALLQVSFLADLVTLVDPTSPHSFLAYLREQGRMYQFYVREQFHPTREEYEDYLRWVARRLPHVHFGHEVESIAWDDDSAVFELTISSGNSTHRHRTRHLVLGVGTAPRVPAALQGLGDSGVVHSGDYLHRIDDITAANHVTVVGSGQSGAECFLDLVRRAVPGQKVSWLTRSASFAPLDYSKLVLEMTTPEYVDHFHALPETTRDELVSAQWRHYKGISTETLDQIHDAVYNRRIVEKAGEVELRQGVGVVAAFGGDELVLELHHTDTGNRLTHRTDLVIAATGYVERPLPLHPDLSSRLHRDTRGRLRLHRNHAVSADGTLDGRIFVANADLHTHGPAAPDLGFGAVRNATIINAVTGRACYPLPRSTAFTTFGACREGASP